MFLSSYNYLIKIYNSNSVSATNGYRDRGVKNMEVSKVNPEKKTYFE